jgi:hypothetical protein
MTGELHRRCGPDPRTDTSLGYKTQTTTSAGTSTVNDPDATARRNTSPRSCNDNAAVTESLDGNEFTGTVTNYLGPETLASGPAGVDGENNWQDRRGRPIRKRRRNQFAAAASGPRTAAPSIAVLGVFLART